MPGDGARARLGAAGRPSWPGWAAGVRRWRCRYWGHGQAVGNEGRLGLPPWAQRRLTGSSSWSEREAPGARAATARVGPGEATLAESPHPHRTYCQVVSGIRASLLFFLQLDFIA